MCDLQGHVVKDAAFTRLLTCQTNSSNMTVRELADIDTAIVDNIIIDGTVILPPLPPRPSNAAAPIVGDGTLTTPFTLVPGTTNGDLLQWNTGTSSWDVAPFFADTMLPLTGDGATATPIALTPGSNNGDILQWNSGTSSWNTLPFSISSAAPLSGSGTSLNPVTFAAGTTNNDILRWNSGTSVWENKALTLSTAAPLTGDGTTATPVALSAGTLNQDLKIWNSGASAWQNQQVAVLPSAKLTTFPLVGDGLLGTEVTLTPTGTALSNSLQWNVPLLAWSLTRSPASTETTVGPGGSGAIYANVASALAAGNNFVRIIGNVTEPAAYTISTSVIIYIDAGATYTTNDAIQVDATGAVLMWGSSQQNSVWSYNSPAGPGIFPVVNREVSFRQLRIINNSTLSSSQLTTPGAIISIESVTVELPPGLFNTFLGDTSVAFYTQLYMNNVELIGNNSTGPVFSSTTDITSGSVVVNNLTLSGTWSGTAINVSQARASWNSIVYKGSTAVGITLHGTIVGVTALSGSGDVTLGAIQPGTYSNTRPINISNVNLGTSGSNVVQLTVPSALETGGRIVANNICCARLNVSGANISIENLVCTLCSTGSSGRNLTMNNCQIGSFVSNASFSTGSKISNITTNGNVGSSPFQTTLFGQSFELSNWVQLTGRLFCNSVSNSNLSNVTILTTSDATAGLVMSSCGTCRCTNFAVNQGVQCTGTTPIFSNCSFGITSAVGGLSTVNTCRLLNVQVLNGPVSFSSASVSFVYNCDFGSTVSIGTNSGGSVSTSVFRGNRFRDTVTLDGAATNVIQLLLANNRFDGTVNIGQSTRGMQQVTWRNNIFGATPAFVLANTSCTKQNFIGNYFTNTLNLSLIAATTTFNGNSFDVAGTLTVDANGIVCTGNQFASGTTVSIPSGTTLPLFTGNLNCSAGVATGPVNANTNSRGNT